MPTAPYSQKNCRAKWAASWTFRSRADRMLGFAFNLALGPAPVPPEVVDAVQEINVDSALDEASMFRLRLGIAQTPLGDWTTLQEDIFRPLAPLTIRLTNNLGIPEVLINGYVSRQ